MTLFLSALVFILGSAVGSFLSVIIYRVRHNAKGSVLGRSYCPSCKKKLKWRHLIPIFSYTFLRGKCAYCGKKISQSYVWLEVLTGLLFLATFLTFNFVEGIPSTVDPTFISYAINWNTLQHFVFYIIEFTLLAGIFFYDLLYTEIPDRFSLPAIAIAIAGVLILGIVSPLSMAIGGVAGFLFFYLQFALSKGKWVGGGDIRLGALMGFLLGWQYLLIALIAGYLLGSIFSIILLIGKKATRKTEIPFGPFLIVGTLTAIFYGEQILSWYLDTLSI